MDKNLRKMINKNFRINIQPKVKSLGAVVKRVRFAVGAGALEKYAGPETAFKAATSALASKGDTYTYRHRSFGRIDFHSK
jgi:hypothetical protein